MAARQTLTLFVWVRILVPQPKQKNSILLGVVFFVLAHKNGFEQARPTARQSRT